MGAEILKSIRVLDMYNDFLSGKTINKQQYADKYNVNVRSVQRDIDSIRDFLSEQAISNGVIQTIEYDRRSNGYRLVTQNPLCLNPGQVLAICKILLESRAFTKKQVTQYLQTVLELCVPPTEKDSVKKCIDNELFYYNNPAHKALDTNILWTLSQAIREQTKIEISYQRIKDKQTVKRNVNPVGILFSEYYFYLMAVIESPDVRADFEKKDDPFPTIYRVDRIKNISLTDEHFSVPYSDKFNEGDYKNKVQYMYGGEPTKLVFEYSGPSIEAVLDRFPTASVVQNPDGSYTVTADTFGNGVIMWLLSQGDKVKVIKPDEYVGKIKNLLCVMQLIYD